MPQFVCSKCQKIESTIIADFFMQKYVEQNKPLCFECKTGKHHNYFEKKIATVQELLKGEVLYFDNFKLAHVVKNRMIDFITCSGKSVLPKEAFDKMKLEQIVEIYRKMKGLE